ncbi:7761_t:CDS:2, partial [Scutellospora calospora]
MIQQNTNIVNKLQAHSPHYYTYAMRKYYFHTCDLLLPKVKSVQVWQLCTYHSDTYYALALFRYEKEFATKFCKITTLVFLDDKHRYKVGEPEYPVAAIERGKQVVVSKKSILIVGDHDYTKSGIILSVIMICDILESVDSNFYAGDIHIGLKDAIFQPFSLICHVVELYNILIKKNITNKPVLYLYTDSGPDHHCIFT